MPKKRQIPFLSPPQKLADGTRVWHWKPSPRLRAAGFINVRLGTDERTAIAAALDLNEQLAAWQKAQAGDVDAVPARPRAPRIVRFAELVKTYRAHPDFRDLREKTRTEYGVRLRQLETWAMDGTLAVRDITPDLVGALRDELLKGSRFRAAAILRVLRLLLAFAERAGMIPRGSNPAAAIRIPEPPARKTFMQRDARAAIVEAAIALDEPDVDLATELGFWMIQRQADILSLSRLAWREISDPDADPRHIAALANARGRVMGFRLQQQKTGTWVDAPVPPWMHDRIEARWKANADWLFPHPTKPKEPMPTHLFQRRFRPVQAAAVDVAIMRVDLALAEAIHDCQYRDLRRTGMTYYGALTKVENVTALSGHAVLGRKTILDVYMPGNTAGAIACVAAGVSAWLDRRKRDEAEAV